MAHPTAHSPLLPSSNSGLPSKIVAPSYAHDLERGPEHPSYMFGTIVHNSPSHAKSDTTLFQPIRTIPVTVLHFLIVIFNQIQVFTSWFEDQIRFPLAQSILFLVFVLTFIFLKAEHRRLRAHGYLHMNLTLILMPLFISAFGAILCAIGYQFLPFDRKVMSLSSVSILQIIVTIQNVFLFFSLLRYAFQSIRHNMTHPIPDVHQDHPSLNHVAPAFTHDVLGHDSIDSPPPNSVLRKQAKMILYLQDQVKSLSQEILRLRQNEFPTLSSSPMNLNSPGLSSSLSAAALVGDADHLLAAKDQEPRAITAERDRLRNDAQKMNQRYESLRKNIESLREEREKNAAQVASLRRELENSTKSYQKLAVMLQVEQEANAHAQKTIEQLRSKGKIGM